jgi:hypothetical protein
LPLFYLIFLHQCSLRRLTCSSPFLEVSLSDFRMSVILETLHSSGLV